MVYGIGVGLLQAKPRMVLGYSSISKMGLLSSGFGIALAHPAGAPLMLSALVLYTLHHLFVKSALFLGVDLLERGHARPWVLGGLMLLGLALIGAPLTSGALAKAWLVFALPAQSVWFATWLAAAAFASTLLMGRLAFLLVNQRSARPAVGMPAFAAWWLLLAIIITLPCILAWPPASLTAGLPLFAAGLATWLVWFYRPRGLVKLVGLIPPGDILQPLSRAMRSLQQVLAHPLPGVGKRPNMGSLPQVIAQARDVSLSQQPQSPILRNLGAGLAPSG